MKLAKKAIALMVAIAMTISMMPISEKKVMAATYGDFMYSVTGSEAIIISYLGEGGVVEIPSEIGEYTVTGIRNSAFGYLTELTEVIIPSTVKYLDEYAFTSCPNLISVEMSDKIESIGNCAFSECTKLEYIEFPNTLVSIGEYAFTGCDGLVEIQLPDSVQSLGLWAFAQCDNLKSIKLSENIKSIGNYTFGMCSSLESIEIPNSVENMGVSVFSECVNLKYVKLSDNLKSMGQAIFYQCHSLENIEIPESLKRIESASFFGCTSIKEINIPENIEFIGSSAFWECSGLNKAVIEGKNTILEGGSLPVSVVIYGYVGSGAELYAELNGNKFIAIDIVPSESESLEINGFQINVANGGLRTVYSVEPEINGVEVVERGLVYGLKDYANIEDMHIAEESDFVVHYAATEKGKYNRRENETETAVHYVMTMTQNFDDFTAEGLSAQYYVRAYAKLSDGTYVYSEVVDYSIFAVADKLYIEEKMSSEDKHDYLYDKILSVVNPEYTKIKYEGWSVTVKP